jgi:hypothetical protein
MKKFSDYVMVNEAKGDKVFQYVLVGFFASHKQKSMSMFKQKAESLMREFGGFPSQKAVVTKSVVELEFEAPKIDEQEFNKQLEKISSMATNTDFYAL